MRVSVLGCGPAGLMAAHAAAIKGHDVQIVSQLAEPSRMGGAQYLHTAIPGITESKPETRILLVMAGTRAGYARRVYGNAQAPTSWARYEDHPFVDGWNLFDAYAKLWDLYGARVEEAVVGSSNWYEVTEGADLVISTIPRRAMCNKDHSFSLQIVWASPEKPAGIGERFSGDFIFYNGEDKRASSFYRVSKLFGQPMTEWSMVTNPDKPTPNAFSISKPLSTNCRCWNGWNVHFIGRYGAWEKNQLVSDAWENANALL